MIFFCHHERFAFPNLPKEVREEKNASAFFDMSNGRREEKNASAFFDMSNANRAVGSRRILRILLHLLA